MQRNDMPDTPPVNHIPEQSETITIEDAYKIIESGAITPHGGLKVRRFLEAIDVQNKDLRECNKRQSDRLGIAGAENKTLSKKLAEAEAAKSELLKEVERLTSVADNALWETREKVREMTCSLANENAELQARNKELETKASLLIAKEQEIQGAHEYIARLEKFIVISGLVGAGL